MRSKYILIVVSVLVATAAAALVVYAGNPGTPSGPPEATSSYTLEAIFNRLVTGAAGMPNTFTEPISGPMVGTGHTLDEIMSVAPSVDDTNGATQKQVLTGRTAWGLTSAGWGLMTGTMPDNGAVVITPETTTQTIAAGYHNGSGYVEGDVDLAGSNIISDVIIFGVTGSYPLAPVPKTGQTKCYTASVASEEDCPEDSGTYPGQDGDWQKGVTWPSPRFTDNSDGTVTDNLTGLIWLKYAACSDGLRDWSTALSDVTELNTNGTMHSTDCLDTSNGGSHQTDWRLPNVRELHSLIDFSQPTGALTIALPSGHPFLYVQVWPYWSSTTNAENTVNAWYVNLSKGNVNDDDKSSLKNVWAVRGGQ